MGEQSRKQEGRILSALINQWRRIGAGALIVATGAGLAGCGPDAEAQAPRVTITETAQPSPSATETRGSIDEQIDDKERQEQSDIELVANAKDTGLTEADLQNWVSLDNERREGIARLYPVWYDDMVDGASLQVSEMSVNEDARTLESLRGAESLYSDPEVVDTIGRPLTFTAEELKQDPTTRLEELLRDMTNARDKAIILGVNDNVDGTVSDQYKGPITVMRSGGSKESSYEAELEDVQNKIAQTTPDTLEESLYGAYTMEDTTLLNYKVTASGATLMTFYTLYNGTTPEISTVMLTQLPESVSGKDGGLAFTLTRRVDPSK